jgi:hypothetical protein
MNVTAPATVSPRPTWKGESPTIWVKNTALPVRKTPSPNAESTDWLERRRTSGVGPARRATRSGRYLDIKRTLDRRHHQVKADIPVSARPMSSFWIWLVPS